MAEASVMDKPSTLAVYVTTIVTITLFLTIVDVLISFFNLSERNKQMVNVRDAVSSSAAEARITARNLEDLVKKTNARWDYLYQHNPQINVPSATSDNNLTKERPRHIPTPTPTTTPTPRPTPKPASTHRHIRHNRATPHPTPWWHFFKQTR